MSSSPQASTAAAATGSVTVGVRLRSCRRRNTLMTSSTTTRLAASPMQIHHCVEAQRRGDEDPLQEADRGDRRRSPAARSPYRRSCVVPGTASRSKIVLRWSRDSSPATRWNSDSVVSSIVDATSAPSAGVADLVGDERADRHDRALDAQPDPVRRATARARRPAGAGAPSARGWARRSPARSRSGCR